jgi:23S rRNA (guanosine2251-2'-O)-methyltransferase
VTKDRPRNRPGGEGGGGFSRGPGAGKPWARDKARTGAPAEHAGPKKHGGKPPFQQNHGQAERSFQDGDDVWIWGLHAARAALANPGRKFRQALLTPHAAETLGLDAGALPAFARLAEPREIDSRLPAGAVHQGAALKAAQLEPLDISDAAMTPERPLVILDQVTDPQNVGAVFRSAAAFGFGGVVMQTRHAPALGGALAKAAAGAIETVREVRAVNLARAIDLLTESGWRVVGLAGDAETTLEAALAGPEPLAVVMGAEGSGLRPMVAKACSLLARIPIGSEMESLNISNAAAIAFYEASRRRSAVG